MEAPQQWTRERDYFDAKAAIAGSFDLDSVADRYERALDKPLYPLEVAYALMGDIRGKRVLDVGCGNGENSLLFARWGAQVVGVDISAGAVALATERAQRAGLSTNVSFREMPFELVENVEDRFDVVWCAAFLHHVLDRLNDVVGKLLANVKPEGIVILSEPVRLSPTVKRLRALVPLRVEGTPDERPLEPQDLAVIRRAFELQKSRFYGPLSRLCARLIMPGDYEKAGRTRRAVSDALFRLDAAIMSMKPTQSAAMELVAVLAPKKLDDQSAFCFAPGTAPRP